MDTVTTTTIRAEGVISFRKEGQLKPICLVDDL
jgi:hypothetical protein